MRSSFFGILAPLGIQIVNLLFHILRPFWKVWFSICFVVPFLLLFPFIFVALITKQFATVWFLKDVWARCICLGSFLFPQIRFQEKKYHLPHPCIIVPNHTSYLDIIFCPFYIKQPAVFMGKVELLKIPLFKYFFVYLDIPVNRKSTLGSHRAFIEAGKKIDEGLSVIIYPEGTIGHHGKLKNFKNGAFKLAIEKQVPIIPVMNYNNWWFLENGGFFKSNGRPGIPDIKVGTPISTVGMTEKNMEELKQKVYTFMHSELEQFYGKHP